MRICENCGKANQVTRRYCIRCGKRLVSPSRPSDSRDVRAEPQPRSKEQKAAQTQEAEAPSQPTPEEPETTSSTITSGDEWVRPSEVVRNRVRHGRAAAKTELEKAQEAFAKGDEALIDDGNPGIVETRMLRASEIHELMKEPEDISQPEPQAVPESGTQTERQSKDRAEREASTAAYEEEMERNILGSESEFVKQKQGESKAESTSAEEKQAPQGVPRKISSEFQSSRYKEKGAQDAGSSQEVEEFNTVPEGEEIATDTSPPQKPITEEEGKHVTTCPECGNVFGVDDFTYPDEVYRIMGEARLKQARFFVVQGNDEKAQEILRIARSLFKKTEDEDGLKQVEKLVDSLAGLD
ncbi:MAG: hypothetical protein R6V83_07355 [Candidatus Thorarchaeota archaeon]